MLRRIRPHLTYANAMASIAVFIALGGSGYAAIRIGSGQIVNNSVSSKDVRNNTLRGKDVRNNGLRGKDIRNSTLAGRDIAADRLTGREILESSLGEVPSAGRAAEATRLGGLTAEELKVRCPAGTALSAAGCIELGFREPEVYGNAVSACALSNRRLPSHAELLATTSIQPAGFIGLGPGGELTSSIFDTSVTPPDDHLVVVLTSLGGAVESVGTSGGNERRFRCVAAPLN